MSYPEEYTINDGGSRNYGVKFAVTTLGARIVAMVSLIVAVAIFQTNDASINGNRYTSNYFHSYRYSFWVALIGLAYTVLQVPFAIHYMLRKKHLINNYAFLKFDFYADKMMAFVVTMAAGTAFGATTELKRVTWGDGEYDQDRMDVFFTVESVAAAFLLAGSIACVISSLHSSLALTNK